MHANYLKWTITMSVERNLGLVCFCRTSVYDWSIKLALLPQPIRCKIKTKNVLVARVFPRFNHFSHFYFEFSSERCFQFLAVAITFILVLRHSNEKRSSALWLYIVEHFFSLVLTNAWQPTSRGRPQCQEKILASQQINMHSFGK